MPVSLIPRRKVLHLGASAFLTPQFLCGKDDSTWFALLADTHIAADPGKSARGVNMADNLKRVVAEILDQDSRPGFAVINGDCAYLKGLPEEYKTLQPLIQPLLDEGIPIHLTMGNHDDRVPFYQHFPEARNPRSKIENRHVTVIEMTHANIFLLDTLQVVNKVTGEVGKEQMAWLSAELNRRKGKPAVLIGHHYPQYLPEGSTATVSGLADTVEFMFLLQSRSDVKAYIYGHSHNYAFKKASGGIHLINQPPVAYLFNETRPNGWLRAQLGPDSLTTELRALDPDHPQQGEVKQLAWR